MFGFLRRHIALVALLAAFLVALLGGAAFFLALRPCHVAYRSGEAVRWRLVQSIVLLDEAGRPVDGPQGRCEEERVLDLFCLGPGNECVLVVEGAGEPQLMHLRFDPDHRCRRYGVDGRLREEGFSLDLFDLNLLRLPPGREQEWRTAIRWAALPPALGGCEFTVRRERNAYRPEFLLTAPTIAWQETSTAWPEAHYVQIVDLECAYRFDPGAGVIDRAVLACVLVEEEPPPGTFRRYAVRMQLTLEDHRPPAADAPARIRLCRALLAEQRRLEAPGSTAGDPDALAVLAGAEDDGPFGRYARYLRGQPGAVAGPPVAGARALRVASTRSAAGARVLSEALIAGGFPVFTRRLDDMVIIYVGPYERDDEEVAATVRRRYRLDDPYWVDAP